MAADLERWVDECEQVEPTEGFNLLIPLFVTVGGLALFGVVFCE
jgi:hypothetical protein